MLLILPLPRLDLSLRYEAQVIASAAIFLASRKTCFPLPVDLPWWEVMGADMDTILIICDSILSLYHMPKVRNFFHYLKKYLKGVMFTYQYVCMYACMLYVYMDIWISVCMYILYVVCMYELLIVLMNVHIYI